MFKLNLIVLVCNNMLFSCVVSNFFFFLDCVFLLLQYGASNHFWIDHFEIFFGFSLN